MTREREEAAATRQPVSAPEATNSTGAPFVRASSERKREIHEGEGERERDSQRIITAASSSRLIQRRDRIDADESTATTYHGTVETPGSIFIRAVNTTRTRPGRVGPRRL